jgi:hypothetical protein
MKILDGEENNQNIIPDIKNVRVTSIEVLSAGGQVIGVTAGKAATKICMVHSEVESESNDQDWEKLVRSQNTQLSKSEQDRLITTLRPHHTLWDGHPGNITAVEHNIPTDGPLISAQQYRVCPAARGII